MSCTGLYADVTQEIEEGKTVDEKFEQFGKTNLHIILFSTFGLLIQYEKSFERIHGVNKERG